MTTSFTVEPVYLVANLSDQTLVSALARRKSRIFPRSAEIFQIFNFEHALVRSGIFCFRGGATLSKHYSNGQPNAELLFHGLMNPLKPKENLYWESYLQSLPTDQRPNEVIVSAGYAGTPEITDELLHLYLLGKKTAGSSIVEDYISAGDPLPQVGNYWIYLNSFGEPSCILRTEKTVTHKFRDVPLEIAIAEGEGDLTLEYWKRVHSELYLPYLKQWGVDDLNEATVITEFFSIVYR